MAHTFVNSVFKKIIDGEIDIQNDTIKGMLLTSSHTTNIDTQEFIDDVSANEASGTGYTAGGFTLDNLVSTTDDTNDRCNVDADDETLSTATLTGRYIAWYKDTGTPGTSPIISIEDLGSDRTSTAGDWVYTVNSGGLYQIQQG